MGIAVKPTTIRTDQRERDLQDLFEAWHADPAARAGIAGRPRSLSFVGAPEREFCHSAWGYRPRVDIVADANDGRRLVIELKLGVKYEPIGLPEVLFHAECLTHPERQVHPVLVTQYNLWNRVVIQSLRRRAREQILDYFEVTVVDLEGAPCFWFDAPLESWQPVTAPPDPIAAFVRHISDEVRDATWLREALHWYEVAETSSYVATMVRCDQRPAVPDVPYVMVAPIDDLSSRWIAWAGIPPELSAVAASWTLDRYWVCSV